MSHPGPDLFGEVRRHRREQQSEGLGALASKGAVLRDISGEDHELRDRRVETHVLEVFRYADDCFRGQSLLCVGPGAVDRCDIMLCSLFAVRCVLMEETPAALQEAINALNTFG